MHDCPAWKPGGRMPASALKDPEDRTWTGTKVKYLYCPDCGQYSGGGVCRQCERGLGEFVPPEPETVPGPFVAVVCSREEGCSVITMPRATNAAEAAEKRQEALWQ